MTTQDYGAGIQRLLFEELENNTTAPHEEIIPPCYPFVKWAGGKTQLLAQLYASCHPLNSIDTLSLFLVEVRYFFIWYRLNINNLQLTYISDINSDLINAYMSVKDDVEKLIELPQDA